jgi:hypothetical protein
MAKNKVKEIEFDNTVVAIISNMHADQSIYTREGSEIIRLSGAGPDRPNYTNILIQNNPPIFPLNYVEANKEKLKSVWFTHKQFMFKKEKLRFRALKRNGINFMTDGWLEIEFAEKIGKDYVLIPKRTPSITKALSQQRKIRRSYESGQSAKPGEIVILENIVTVLSKLNSFYANWKNLGINKQQIIEEDLIRLINYLDGCFNEYKSRALDQILDVASGEDSKGRFNPPAWAAMLRSALTDIDNRLKQIAPRLARSVLRYQLLKLEHTILETERLASIRDLKMLISPQGFQVLNNPKKAELAIGKIQYYIHRFWVSPYYVVYKDCEKLLHEASMATGFKKKNLSLAREKLLTVLYILNNEIRHKPIDSS